MTNCLDGEMLRVRTWACRPTERPNDSELKRASHGDEPGESDLTPVPPAPSLLAEDITDSMAPTPEGECKAGS